MSIRSLGPAGSGRGIGGWAVRACPASTVCPMCGVVQGSERTSKKTLYDAYWIVLPGCLPVGAYRGPGVQLAGLRGCTLGKKFKFVKGPKSVIWGVWAAPGAPETFPKGGGLRPPPFARVSGAIGAAQTPKMTDFRSLKFVFIILQPSNVQRSTLVPYLYFVR